MRIGMIGYGTVGQGVSALLQRHREDYTRHTGAPVSLATILVRDASRMRDVEPPPGCELTDDPEAFFATPFDMLVEVAGGLDPAEDSLVRALSDGRDVVTANKALIAAKGEALFAHAEKNRARIGIEATVAGGVPVIEPLTSSLAANRIDFFAGIVNGTCNFILDRLIAGDSYDDAVREAQRLGYAEADPTLDVSGRDSLEKLAIIATIAFVGRVELDAITTRGIEGLSANDAARARDAGCAIKLLALARRDESNRVSLHNGPVLVPMEHPLARVPGADMGVLFGGDAMSNAFIAGSGAGRFPTASAVVADILRLASMSARRSGTLNRWPIDAAPLEFVGDGLVVEADDTIGLPRAVF
ncbi:MAG: homoserine dehydrogenase [Planctomycetota bacterium]